jgi:hypothetical protein
MLRLTLIALVAASVLGAAALGGVPSVVLADEGCVNEALRQEQQATSLPDCRAWEMVSGQEKNGGNVASVPSRTRAAVGGEAATFVSLDGFGDVAGMGTDAEFESVRTAQPGTSGWSTHSIMPKLEPVPGSLLLGGMSIYRGFSPDLSAGVLATYTNIVGDPSLGTGVNLYLRRDLRTAGAGSYQPLSGCLVCATPPTLPEPPVMDAATASFDQVFFESFFRLTPDAPSQSEKCAFSEVGTKCAPLFYEWDRGTLRYVGILPDSEGGGPAPRSISAKLCVCSRLNQSGQPEVPQGSVSEDGSHVLFSVPKANSGPAGPLYMRVDHSSTVKVSASERQGIADPNANTIFQAGSSDLSRIFFLSESQLTDEAINGPRALYLYEAQQPEGHHLTLIAPSAKGVIGASADGHYLYFVSENRLLPAQPPFPPSAKAGVYLWHDGTLSVVGAVSGGDIKVDSVGLAGWGNLGARVTPDGRHVLFTSHSGEGLTGYDQSAPQPGCGGSFCPELYVYSADVASLQCVSCNPTGAPPTEEAGFTLETKLGGTPASEYHNHPISDDGRYVFFTSGERLVPEDHNTVADVYEFDSQTGQLHLLSSGVGDQPSLFMDASPDGHDVFFTTFDRLVGWDFDESNDLYDARIGGGVRARRRFQRRATPPRQARRSAVPGIGNSNPKPRLAPRRRPSQSTRRRSARASEPRPVEPGTARLGGHVDDRHATVHYLPCLASCGALGGARRRLSDARRGCGHSGPRQRGRRDFRHDRRRRRIADLLREHLKRRRRTDAGLQQRRLGRRATRPNRHPRARNDGRYGGRI